jgi:ATP-dependent exoDNAse (exonuclease V) alpha subunit
VFDTGVHVEIPAGYAGFIKSKSGLNVKKNLQAEGVIDAGYTGPIVVKVYNHGDEDVYICAGDKLTQLVILPVALPELELAYAMTVHKSQGSEYRAVVLVAFSGAPMLLTRGVLYTAITRAKDLLVIVGKDEIVCKMVTNDRQARRYSGLRARLAGGQPPAPPLKDAL